METQQFPGTFLGGHLLRTLQAGGPGWFLWKQVLERQQGARWLSGAGRCERDDWAGAEQNRRSLTVKPAPWMWKLGAQAAGHSRLALVLKVARMPPFYQSLAAGGQER